MLHNPSLALLGLSNAIVVFDRGRSLSLARCSLDWFSSTIYSASISAWSGGVHGSTHSLTTLERLSKVGASDCRFFLNLVYF